MNQIIQGDAIEELKKLPENSVDAIITDPPYNITQSENLNESEKCPNRNS